ncbi:hypothetical protein ATEIFO6365_0007043600 [Aspergillus terreus]|uniref:Uncharacterized protein n=1 Tax=Aspergillus terreus TaxID=33178 RepID=A0A5M3Z4V6_ASPTE|nr:hypothetical protein ATETN484_0009043600 [Aspergillus terreus]GFF17887.1 hypothetical protein ATEIFO6365_0007043600 [Aspergillus terreus]
MGRDLPKPDVPFIVEARSEFSGVQRGMQLVAKVYDPLYCDDDPYINPFRCVDNHYTHEVHTYHLLSDFQGKSIPKFYGSFSLDIPTEGSELRTVRLILLEYIPGSSMQQANPKNFSQQTRQLMLKAIVDFESLLYQRDMLLQDLSPRNVMIVDATFSYENGRNLVFIDFVNVLFGRVPDDMRKYRRESLLGKYISSVLRWRNRGTSEFRDWVDWEWKPWVENEFAHTVSSITPEMREVYNYH